tara:strand:- start:436 stop:3057 length:2622 start_codon:yes stop_codon:yes gene_type:complete
MDNFLQKVIDDIKLNQDTLNHVFILPNKRACFYFSRLFLSSSKKTRFAPEIISIDSFIKKMSGLNEIDEETLILRLFKEYLKIQKNNRKESFNEFYSWGKKFLKDTSELEQHLLSPDKVLKELIEINKINFWGDSGLINSQNELKFWSLLPKLYQNFKHSLFTNQEGTKGICYSEAKNNLELYKQANPNLNHIFIGLNALTKAETIIIKELLEFNNAEIYWDIDKEFLRNKAHGASRFIRNYKNSWNRFKKKPFKWVSDDYKKDKKITIIETPKFIGQANVISTILSDSEIIKNGKTAVILGEEQLIKPLLNVNPINSKNIDVTINLQPNFIELRKIIEIFFEFQLDEKKEKEVLLKNIYKYNLVKNAFPNSNILFKYIGNAQENLSIKHKSLEKTFEALLGFLNKIITHNKENSDQLYLVQNFVGDLMGLKQKLKNISFNYDSNLLKSIVLNRLNKISIKFKPNSDAKIKIMGILESRCLNFENIIISSLNEGVLPKGKIQNSLIPFDLRKKHGLLTHSEMDSIYTYHFYRLIKRAKKIFLVYNNNNEGIYGGGKSRFIHQLEQEHSHNIERLQSNPAFSIDNKSFEFGKSKTLLNKLKEIAKKGFSPSFLAQYLKDPHEFVLTKLLDIQDSDEEQISPRKMGLIFHETLELLYQPFIGQKLDKKKLQKTLKSIDVLIKNAFVKNKLKNIKQGKIMVAFEVVKNSLKNFINMEIKDLEMGNEIILIALEKKMEIPLEILDLKTSIKLKGIVDRIDKRNDIIRIIDYKTGLIKENEVLVKDIASSFNATKTKSMQLLCYALLYLKNNEEHQAVQAGLFSLRNIKQGLLKFGIREGFKTTNLKITNNEAAKFEDCLKKLVCEIMDPDIAFPSRS